MQEEAMENSKC